MTLSRLIRSEAVADELPAWNAPSVTGAPLRGSEEELAALENQATARGFENGKAAGLAAANAEIEARSKALESVLDALARPFVNLDRHIEEELLALVQAITHEVVRHELKTDPEHIVGVIREGLAALPASSEEVVIRINPADADVVRDCLRDEDVHQGWSIAADATIERGGCEIETKNSIVDAQIETRLNNVIATMFEDERISNA
ncbi:MAG: flagellar assembly protein FliH [Gammaproteobacteria bacterium]|nr:flagellar assembly protein FliH [Gammaproteobacteria bacterium]